MSNDWRRFLDMDPDEAVEDSQKRTKFRDNKDAFRSKKKVKKYRNRKRGKDFEGGGEWK